MHQLSRRAERWIKGTALVVTAALTAAAVLMVLRVEVSGADAFTLPPQDEYLQQSQAARSHFQGTEYIVVTVSAEEPLSPSTVRTVQRLSEELARLDGVASVYSIATVEQTVLEDGVIRRTPLVPAGEYDEGEVRRRLDQTPLYDDLFLPTERPGQFIYVLPRADADDMSVAGAIRGIPAIAEDPDVFAYGPAIARRLIMHAVVPELLLIGSISAAAILLLNVIIFGSLSVAVVASLAGLLPATWVVGFYPLFGVQLHALTSLAPVMTLILSTTYSFHVLRILRMEATSFTALLRHTGPVVLGAAATTALGMACLLVTHEPQVRALSVLVIIGIALSVGVALLALPTVAGRMNLATTSLWDRLLRRVVTAQGQRRAPRVRLLLILPLLGAVVVVGTTGIPSIRLDHRAARIFATGSEPYELMARHSSFTGGSEQLELIVDTGEAYGVIAESAYAGVREIHEALESDPSVEQVVSIVPFIGTAHGTLLAANTVVQPASDRQIAEALETLEEGRQALSIGSLIDAEWQRVRYFMWFADPAASAKDAREELATLTRTVERRVAEHLPDSEWVLAGDGLARLRAKSYHTRSLYISLGLFIAIASVLLGFVFRNLKTVGAILLPAVAALVVYLGITGLGGLDLALALIFTAVMLLGVGNDDALYFSLTFRRFVRVEHRERALSCRGAYSGIPIVQTCLMIIVGSLPRLLSSYRVLRHVAVLFPLAMTVCTVLTLLVTPRIIYHALPGPAPDAAGGRGWVDEHGREDPHSHEDSEAAPIQSPEEDSRATP